MLLQNIFITATSATPNYQGAESSGVLRTAGQNTTISDIIYNTKIDDLKQSTSLNVGSAQQFIEMNKIPTISDVRLMLDQTRSATVNSASVQSQAVFVENGITYYVYKLQDGTYVLRTTQGATINGLASSTTSTATQTVLESFTVYPTIFSYETINGVQQLVKRDGHAVHTSLPTSNINDLSKISGLPVQQMAQVQEWVQNNTGQRFINLEQLDNVLTGANLTAYNTFKQQAWSNGLYTAMDNATYNANKIVVPKIWFGEVVNAQNKQNTIAMITYNIGYLAWLGEASISILYNMDEETISVQVGLTCFTGSVVGIANDGTFAWGDNYYSTDAMARLLKITYLLCLENNQSSQQQQINSISYRFSGQGVALPDYELTMAAYTPGTRPFTSPLDSVADQLRLQNISGLYALFLEMVNIFDVSEFANQWNSTTKQYVLNNVHSWRYDWTTGKYVLRENSASLLLYGIHTRAAVFAALGIFETADVRSLISSTFNSLNFQYIDGVSGLVAALSDRFMTMVYKDQISTHTGYSLTSMGALPPAGTQDNGTGFIEVTFCCRVALPMLGITDNMQKILSHNTKDPFSDIRNGSAAGAAAVKNYGLIQKIIKDPQGGYHVLQYYTAIKENIAQPINQGGLGVVLSYMPNGDVIYRVFLGQPSLVGDKNTYYNRLQFEYKVTATNFLTITKIDGNDSFVLRSEQLS